MKPPLQNGKFVAYGGPGEKVPTELVCRIAVDPGDGNTLWVVPDPEYAYLAIAGNRLHPSAGEDGHELAAQIAQNGYGGQPIIKCETYAVGGWPDTGRPEQIYVPDRDHPDGSRPLKLRDHVLLTGLYVTDNHHGMYHNYWTDTFSYWRGALKAGYVHAEIHPVERDSIHLIEQMDRGGRRHAVGVPLCEQIYTEKHLANQAAGVAGHFVEDAIRTHRTERIRFYPETPRPSPDYVVLVSRSDEVRTGSGNLVSIRMSGTDTSGYVEIEVHGEDFANPFVYMATFTATWRLREEVQVTVPAVIGLKRRDAALKIEAAGLTPWHSGPGRTVDSTDPPAGRKVTRRSRVKLVCPPSVGTDGGGQGNPP